MNKYRYSGIPVLVLISLLLLGSLYLYRVSIAPQKIQLNDLREHMGEYVEVQGLVSSVTPLDRGMVLTLENGSSRITVYLNFREKLGPGYDVAVRGIVTTYRGKVEILVEHREDLIVKSNALSLSLRTLLSSPQSFLGMRVEVQGTISDIKATRDYHYLKITDGTHTAWVHVPWRYYGERRVHLAGTVKDGMLFVENISLSEKVCTCRNVSIGDIEKHEGERIHVYGIVISYSRFSGYSAKLRDGEYELSILSFKPLNVTTSRVVVLGDLRYVVEHGMYQLVVVNVHPAS